MTATPRKPSTETGNGKATSGSPESVEVAWREEEFQRWFGQTENSILPGGETLLVISLPPPFKRVVDIVAVDHEGGLVIIEVKNERSTRAAVGQALEYLSQYQDVTLEDLEDEYAASKKGSLAQAFTGRFESDLTTISRRRRVFVAAPEFDYHSDICMQFLSKAFAEQQVEFRLLKVSCVPGESKSFDLAVHDPIKLTSAKDLHGLVMSTGGRIYYVLDCGANPVMWLIGKRGDDGQLRLPKATALKRLIRIRRKKQVLLNQVPKEIQPAVGESTWQKNKDAAQQVRLIGVIRQGACERAALARFKNNQFVKYQFKDMADLRAKWTEVKIEGLPGWRALATLTAKGSVGGTDRQADLRHGGFDEGAIREAVKCDLKDVADYGSDDTFTVAKRAWVAVYGEVPMPEEVADAVYQIVDDEWDWWFEEGPID
jgi:hypothetical protein